MKLSNFASLDSVITGSGRAGLAGASAGDREIWHEMKTNWPVFAVAAADAMQSLGYPTPGDQPSTPTAPPDDFAGAEQPRTHKERIGQALFRKTVLSAYESRCCITGLQIPTLLVASHIVPWRADPDNRLNPANGLCLSALHDKAFDIGLITIQADWTLAISPSIRENSDTFWQNAIADYEGCEITLPSKFSPDPDFLAHHRTQIFQH